MIQVLINLSVYSVITTGCPGELDVHYTQVGGAAFLYKRSTRGKRAGALVKFRQHGFRTPLQSIHLANLRSLANKSDELQLLTRTNKDFLNSAALCFTETWLNGTIPDSALHLTGFQLIRADRVTESSGKKRGGGSMKAGPFYSPREFSSFILVSVYIPPDACASAALELLADQITSEQRYPDSFMIVLGDFNKAHLTRELPKYRQRITCPTRDSNILDHCYTVLKDAYHSVPLAALGLSDHCLVHLLPAYRQKLKSAKPVLRTVKRWTVEAELDLQACFKLTDWSVFEAATTDLDELTDTDLLTFNNDKPWFSVKLRQLRQAKEDAYRSGDKALYKQAKYTLNREVRVAKLNYSGKLKKQLSRNDSKSVWNGLKAITSYKSPSPSTEANQQLADDLNEFYCRFEKQKTGLTPYTHPDCPTTQPSTPCPSIPPTVSQPALKICEGDVCKVFRKQKTRKAKGPDGVSSACLKACAVQLSSIFTLIFNRSLELCIVPSCFKCFTIIPVPKKSKITGLNDYRPVALTSVVLKLFERLVLSYLKDITGPFLDPLQFAYRANSSAFNTIIPDILQNKLSQLSVPTSICQWITSFLTDRQQLVRLGKLTSGTRTISTGAPQGCVLSPLLFSLYTNDCTSKDPSVKLLKFADDTTVIGLIRDVTTTWSSTVKTVEMTIDFQRKPPALIPLTIMNSTVAAVDSFKFLGTNISQDLKWDIHIDSIVKKAQQRLYFLRQLKKFNLPQALMTQFYSAVIESVLCSSITVWFGAASKSDIRRLQRTVRTAERIIGVHLPNLQDLYISRVKKRAGNNIQDPSHPGHNLFALLPSGRRYRSLNTKTSRHKNSFFPNAISSLNRYT
ncbi:putative RNA-directed DNA polymerase from transposon BS [Labeo rohita]|uniref:RNA-directed DNA polymerase from transposon BS n=1 Tax=Labeo rohita TaxID=84645 RepID=A0ABQ8LKB5_LABRO|nr:putative RNA-directed DNA polymerase from transposon BS [Labeo rohita]